METLLSATNESDTGAFVVLAGSSHTAAASRTGQVDYSAPFHPRRRLIVPPAPALDQMWQCHSEFGV